ncbi:glycosyltransferase family 4 protein [Flavicella sp.]|uniref:MraY family glycosyltransferase n=1 Tax=Flavicella sp. TaxID=2957742 RepID=UPI003018C0ED
MEKYGIIIGLLIILSFIYLKVADHFDIIDKPNHRSSHTTPTIRGGGIVFLFALWIFFFTSNYSYPYLVLGTTLIAVVSFIDDIKTLSSSIRFPFQILAILLIMQQMQFSALPWWGIAVLLFIGVGFVNLYNFMDGINGITGMYSLAVFSGMYIVNQETEIVNQDLILIVVISVVIFGFFNFRKKARCFAGDIGSISIAVMLFFIGASLVYNLQAPVLILFAVVYGADSIQTMMYRKYLGEKITEPHRHHIYQKLVDINKTPHLMVSAGYAVLQLLINGIVFMTYKKAIDIQLIVFLSVVVFLVCIYIALFLYLDKKKSMEHLYC